MKSEKWLSMLIALGSVLGLAAGAAGAAGQHPGHSAHPLMRGQELYLQVQLIGGNPVTTEIGPSGVAVESDLGKKVDVPLSMVTTEAAQTLDLTIPLPAPRKSIMVQRYLPKAVLEQEVRLDETGQGMPAVELSIAGPSQSLRRWLIANDPERNRLSSYIGTWRFMAVKSEYECDALWKQFETEFTRAPELVIRRTGDSHEQRIMVEAGGSYGLEDQHGKITVRKFYPDCGMDRTTGEATNQSQRRKNPAVLIEIENDGAKESRWVFAKFPGFGPAEGHSLPYQVTLDCAVESAEALHDFAIVAVGAKTELWTRSAGVTKSRPLTADEKVSVPGSSYQFIVGKVVPSARKTEFYKKDEKGKAALEIAFAGSGGKPDTVWIELGHTRSITTADGPIMVSFLVRDGSRKGSLSGGGHP